MVPFFAVNELPAGVSGLVIACIFAASMAVMSAGINSLTTAHTVDIYQRVFRPNAPQEHYVTVGRLGNRPPGVSPSPAWPYHRRRGDLVTLYPRVAGVLTGPILGIFLLGTMTRRATSAGVLAGACAASWPWPWPCTPAWSFLLYGPCGVAATAVAAIWQPVHAQAAYGRIQGLVMGRRRARLGVSQYLLAGRKAVALQLRLAIRPDLPDGVDAPSLAFVVGPHDQLSQQPGAEQHDPGQQQQSPASISGPCSSMISRPESLCSAR